MIGSVGSNPSTKKTDRLLIYMHCAYFLVGVGIMMLGPLLPLLSRQWQLADGASGTLLAAQFAGSFCGAVLLQFDLRRSLSLGSVCLVAGYSGMACATHFTAGFPLGVGALLVSGFGVGQLCNSISLIAGRRYKQNRGRALMSLNLIWSAGALLSPLFVGFAVLHLSLQGLIGLFALAGVMLLIFQRSLAAEDWFHQSQSVTQRELPRLGSQSWSTWILPGYFAFLFFLYGALENSLSGWLSSFAVRYTHTTVSSGVFSTSMLWVGITAGRALGLLLLRFLSEKQVQLISLLTATLTSALLILVHTPVQLLILAVAIGCGLAPFIPVTTSLLLSDAQPTTRQAGFVLASSALGAAFLQWSVGILSQHLGSLKLALELPTCVGALLLMLCSIKTAKVLSLFTSKHQSVLK
jgi:fucose permease